MDREAKQILSVLGIAAILAGFVYGSYLPLEKAQRLDYALNNSGSTTISQFEADFRYVFDYPSPAGQYEVLKNFLDNEVVGFLQNSKNIPQPVSDEVVKFAMSYNIPIIASGRGLNFSQFLLSSGEMYQFMGQAYGNKADLDQAVAYYKEGLKHSPRRPQFLYSLLSSYLSEGDKIDAKKTAEEILSYWPTDGNVRNTLEALNK